MAIKIENLVRNKNVELAWQEQIKKERTTWGADTFPPLTTEWDDCLSLAVHAEITNY